MAEMEAELEAELDRANAMLDAYEEHARQLRTATSTPPARTLALLDEVLAAKASLESELAVLMAPFHQPPAAIGELVAPLAPEPPCAVVCWDAELHARQCPCTPACCHLPLVLCHWRAPQHRCCQGFTCWGDPFRTCSFDACGYRNCHYFWCKAPSKSMMLRRSQPSYTRARALLERRHGGQPDDRLSAVLTGRNGGGHGSRGGVHTLAAPAQQRMARTAFAEAEVGRKLLPMANTDCWDCLFGFGRATNGHRAPNACCDRQACHIVPCCAGACFPAAWFLAWPNKNYVYRPVSDGSQVHAQSLYGRARAAGALNEDALALLRRYSAADLPRALADGVDATTRRARALVADIALPVVDGVLSRCERRLEELDAMWAAACATDSWGLVGTTIKVLSKTENWRDCVVTDCEAGGRGLRVHYEGYDAKWDEWIEHGSERLRLPAGAAVGAALAEEAAGGGGGGGGDGLGGGSVVVERAAAPLLPQLQVQPSVPPAGPEAAVPAIMAQLKQLQAASAVSTQAVARLMSAAQRAKSEALSRGISSLACSIGLLLARARFAPLGKRLKALRAELVALQAVVPRGQGTTRTLVLTDMLEKHEMTRKTGTDTAAGGITEDEWEDTAAGGGGAAAAKKASGPKKRKAALQSAVGKISQEIAAARREVLAKAGIGGAAAAPAAAAAAADMSNAALKLSGLTALAQCFESCETAAAELREGSALLGQSKPGGAYLPNVGSTDDEKVREHWTRDHAPLPEYRRAAAAIAVESEWMNDTGLLRQIRMAGARYGEELKGMGGDGPADRWLLAAIRKGYDLKDDGAARGQPDLVSGQNIFAKVKQVWKNLEGWKRPYMTLAFKILVDHDEDRAAIVTKLSEVVDRALHCRQVQVLAFNLMISHAFGLVQEMEEKERNAAGGLGVGGAAPHRPGSSRALLASPFEAARLKFWECMADYTDDHKENAFKSAFMEPARFFFHYKNHREGWCEDNVDTHANNWYIALLNAALSVHVPIMPAYWDDWPETVCDFWAGLSEEAWAQFSAVDHFGMGYNGILPLRDGKRFIKDHGVPRAAWPRGHRPPRAKTFANDAVNPKGNGAHRKVYARYLERFAGFFSRDFFVRKSFNKLNTEEKPTHMGFRKACEAVFEVFRAEQLEPREAARCESFVEYAFDDDMYTQLNVTHVARFYVWMGVLKPEHDTHCRPARVDGVAAAAAAAAGEVSSPGRPRLVSPNGGGNDDDDADESKSSGGGNAVLPMMHGERLVEIAKELLDAQRSRDIGGIRRLMAERNTLKAEQQDALDSGRAAPTPKEQVSARASARAAAEAAVPAGHVSERRLSRDQDQLRAVLTRLHSSGELDILPTEAEAEAAMTPKAGEEEEGEECALCLELLDGSDPCFLPCTHRFHSACVRQWFGANGTENNKCPTCMTAVPAEVARAIAAGGQGNDAGAGGGALATAAPPAHAGLVGTTIKVLSKTENWRDCVVTDCEAGGRGLRVHYEGYDAKWDEWIEHGSERLRLPAGAAVGAALAEEAAGGGGGGGAAAAAIAFAPAPAVVSFVEMFLGMFTAARGQGAQERAGVFEIWQMFEMEHDAAPGHIVDAAQLLLRQPGFLGMLTRENAEFLRDAAGVLMRVHGMLLDGNFVPAPETAGACQRLGAAVERLVAQFEGESPAKTDGHHVGAFYMQVVTPWLCACRLNGMGATFTTDRSAALVRRAGNALVNWWRRQGSPPTQRRNANNTLNTAYLSMIQHSVWGSAAQDVVWQTFCDV